MADAVVEFQEAFRAFLDKFAARDHKTRLLALGFSARGFNKRGFAKIKKSIYHFEGALDQKHFCIPAQQPIMGRERAFREFEETELIPKLLRLNQGDAVWVISGRTKELYISVSIQAALDEYVDSAGGTLILFDAGREALYVNEYGHLWLSNGIR